MKRLSALFLFLLFLAFANAQSFTISPSDSVSTTEVDSSLYSTINGQIFLYNHSSDTVTVKWRLLSDTVPMGWSIMFCDNKNCYNLPTQQTSLPLVPGDSIDMHAQFSPACISGSGSFSIGALVQKGSTTLASYTFKYSANVTSACVSAINNINNNPAISVFPNPANEQISIGGLIYGKHVTIQVIDLKGRVIITENKVADNLINCGISELPSGLYLVKIIDKEANQTTIHKFSKL